MVYLELLYEIVNMALDKPNYGKIGIVTKDKRDIREQFRKLNKEDGKICSIKFNLRKNNLNRKLEGMNNQSK